MPGKNSVGKTKKNSSATPRQKKSKQNSQEPKQEQDRAQSPASPKEESGHWFSNEREQRIAALLPGIRKKKPEALAAFFEEFSDDIYNFPMRVFRLSEDEASEFYLYAFEHLRDGRKIASFQGKSRFTTWFYAVLRNLTIDFLRTQKDKLRAAAFLRTDSSGRVFDATEQLADAPEQELYEETLFAKFRTALTALPLQQRVLFKLAYAWYFELEPDEIDYLCNLHRQDTAQIVLRLQQLKTIAHERSVEVRELEERLTANFQGISILESKLESFFRENPDIPKQRELWSEEFFSASMPPHIIDMIQSLMKKKKKQQALLLQQKRSLLSIRVPYRELEELLRSTQGVLSVQLIRIIDKLSQSLATQPGDEN